MTEMFFMKGEPNISVRMMEIKDRKPIPTNSAEPQGIARGALILGQSAKNPFSGRSLQSLDPPPQFAIPESPMSDDPIMRITVPVTIGGNILLSARAEQKDMNISRKEHISDVPRSFPYASGQGPRTSMPSTVEDGQVPSLYIALKTAVAVVSVEKLVPTTVIKPVPM